MIRALILLAILTILAGCSTPSNYQTHRQSMTPEQQAQTLLESQQRADILRKLPGDADFEDINEQVRLHELGQYVDIKGHRRSLNEPVAVSLPETSTTAPVLKAEPNARPSRQAPVHTATESISFDPLPPPVDILKGRVR